MSGSHLLLPAAPCWNGLGVRILFILLNRSGTGTLIQLDEEPKLSK